MRHRRCSAQSAGRKFSRIRAFGLPTSIAWSQTIIFCLPPSDSVDCAAMCGTSCFDGRKEQHLVSSAIRTSHSCDARDGLAQCLSRGQPGCCDESSAWCRAFQRLKSTVDSQSGRAYVCMCSRKTSAVAHPPCLRTRFPPRIGRTLQRCRANEKLFIASIAV